MKEIPLTRELLALVDDEDYETLSSYKWLATPSHGGLFYAKRFFTVSTGNEASEYMHRRILGLQPGDQRVADHINGDGLDNRRLNLRIVTRAENVLNVQMARYRRNNRSTSMFRGVSFHARAGKWVAAIKKNRVTHRLGTFESEIDAAKAYDTAARRLHGKFAYQNLLMEDESR